MAIGLIVDIHLLKSHILNFYISFLKPVNGYTNIVLHTAFVRLHLLYAKCFEIFSMNKIYFALRR